MIVAVDTMFLSGRYRYTGTGVYLSSVLSECLKIAESSGLDAEFRGFIPSGESWDKNGFASPRFRILKSRVAAHRRAWVLGGMALSTSLARPNVVFMPTAHWAIPNPLIPTVTTILDAMPFRLPPEMVSGRKRLCRMTRINARFAKRIVTISSWSKRDLVELLNLNPGLVDVTYPGYDKHLYNTISPDQRASDLLLARLGIRRPYVLHHGMVQLRKNLIRLIDAWGRVAEGPGALETQLVLAGPPGLGYEQILEAIAASPYRERIVLTGALETAELATLVKNASLCVIPSLYEGFCLPMVEAMACGVPTIASRASCLPEVSGGVLEYFDPLSVEEMAERIRKALDGTYLRERLRRDGLARAAEFSWERCARETLDVFARTVADHGR